MFHHPLAARPSRSLAVRGGLAHTFGSLAGFLVVSFLCWGIYILEDAFANPLDAGAAAIISAAFIIAVGVILLFYLLKPGMKPRDAPHVRTTRLAAAPDRPYYIPPSSGSTHHADLRSNLSYQRFYVDHFRIRQ
jgi:hypothetical protein